MYAAFNPFSASIQAEALKIRMTSKVSAKEALEQAIAAAQIAYEARAMKAEIKTEVFKLKVETGRDIAAPADIVAIVKAEYERRAFERSRIRADYKARGEKLNLETLSAMLPRYSSRAAMIVARNWAKAQWAVGACYAMAVTLDSIREGASK